MLLLLFLVIVNSTKLTFFFSLSPTEQRWCCSYNLILCLVLNSAALELLIFLLFFRYLSKQLPWIQLHRQVKFSLFINIQNSISKIPLILLSCFFFFFRLSSRHLIPFIDSFVIKNKLVLPFLLSSYLHHPITEDDISSIYSFLNNTSSK